MATERQIGANRRNARASTGPKSAEGKTASARNAVRHGLTLPPAQRDLLRWYRIVTEEPEAALPGNHAVPSERAALRLAETEARLERCQAAEREVIERFVEKTLGPRPQSVAALQEAIDLVDHDALLEGRDAIGQLLVHALRGSRSERAVTLRLLRRLDPDRPAELRRRLGILRQHRRRAEGRRRRAFRAWIAASAAKSKNAPTKPNAT